MIKFQHKRIWCNCATSRKIREHNVQIISPWKAFLHKFWRISYPFTIFLLFVNIYQWFASESLRHFGLCARISTPIKKILVQVYVDFYVEMKNEEAAFSTPLLPCLPFATRLHASYKQKNNNCQVCFSFFIPSTQQWCCHNSASIPPAIWSAW